MDAGDPKYKFVSAWLDIKSGKHLYFGLYSMTLFDISHAAMFLVFSFPAAAVVTISAGISQPLMAFSSLLWHKIMWKWHQNDV